MAQIQGDTPDIEQLGPLPLALGTVIDERYELTAYLGAGGMGSVYKARHLEIARDAAIKLLHQHYTEDVSAVKRFQREARAASTLHHPHILTVYSFGGFEGYIYLAMEYVQGKSLGQVIWDDGAMKPEQAVPLLLQICDAMAHAHKNDVLHRDLKPDNVMMVAQGQGPASAKVVDFGLAKLLDGTDGQRLTRTGEVVGDPRYMSPEQCKGVELTAGSDVYSFGCLMYELLTGKTPFEAEEPLAVMSQQIEMEPPPFPKHLALPAALEAITLNALAKERHDRYDSFQAVSELLRKFQTDPNLKVAPVRRTRKRRALSPRQLTAVIAATCVGVLVVGAICVPPAQWSMLPARLQVQFSNNAAEKINGTLALAAHHERRGEQDQALLLYENASRLAADNKDHRAMLRSLLGAGRTYNLKHREPEAKVAYGQALTEALAVAKSSEPDEEVFKSTLSALEASVKLDAVQAAMNAHLIAAEYMRTKHYKYARSLLESVANYGPKPMRANTLLAIGAQYLKEGDRKKAKLSFERGIALYPPGPHSSGLAQIAGTTANHYGDYDVAIPFLQMALADVAPTDYVRVRGLHRQLADCFFHLRDLRRAEEHYTAAVATQKKLPAGSRQILFDDLNMVGQARYNQANYQGAEQAFREQVAVLDNARSGSIGAGDRARALCLLGDSLTQQHKYLQAADQFERALAVIDQAPSKKGLEELQATVAEKFRTHARARAR